MPREAIFSPAAPAPGGAYSPVVRAGSFLFVSGQAALDPATGQVVGTTVTEQVERTMRNIALQLEGAGSSLADVVKTTVFLARIADFDEFNRVYKTFFEGVLPARTTVGVEMDNILVEIDAVAYTS